MGLLVQIVLRVLGVFRVVFPVDVLELDEVGGGTGAFIGYVHRVAAHLDLAEGVAEERDLDLLWRLGFEQLYIDQPALDVRRDALGRHGLKVGQLLLDRKSVV